MSSPLSFTLHDFLGIGKGIADVQEMKRAESLIERRNREIFNPAGLNVLSPRYAALQFVCPLSATFVISAYTDAK